MKRNGNEIPDNLMLFTDWEFSSGGTTGKDFKIFAMKFKSHIMKNLPKGTILRYFNSGHYYVSGFVQKGNKFVYFSIPDVRFSNNEWMSNILIRTAESLRDFTGGVNSYTTLHDFKSRVNDLLNRI